MYIFGLCIFNEIIHPPLKRGAPLPNFGPAERKGLYMSQEEGPFFPRFLGTSKNGEGSYCVHSFFQAIQEDTIEDRRSKFRPIRGLGLCEKWRFGL